MSNDVGTETPERRKFFVRPNANATHVNVHLEVRTHSAIASRICTRARTVAVRTFGQTDIHTYRRTDVQTVVVAYTHVEAVARPGRRRRVARFDDRRPRRYVSINRPSRKRGWSSSARHRRESTASISIVKCAADRCADWTACVAPRRSSIRSTASATPQSRPAGGSTRTRNTFRDCIR